MQKVGNVEFYAGPKNVGAPDDLEEVVVKFIDGATKRLEIAVQELESQPIGEAIIRARQRKLLVKLVLELDYLRARRARRNPWEPGGKNEKNRKIHNAILRANIDVKADYNASIFHQKFIVRDGTAVLTGSTNFTPTGVGKNLNHIVIVRDADVARTYAREFREIQQGRFGKRGEGQDPTPPKVIVSSIPIKILFAPDHSPEMEIMKQMLKGRKRIDFAIFTFSQSSGIDDTMILLRELKRPIRGVFDANMGAMSWSAIPELKKKGVKLFKVRPSGALGKLHHKLMVIDEQVVIAGSFNYTGPANRVNDENIIILGDLDTTSSAAREAQKKIARFALKEIDRIVAKHATAI